MNSTQEGDFKVGDILSGESSRYQIKGFPGKGGSAIVTKCIKLGTNEMLAVKIFNKDLKEFGEREVDMYENLKKLDRNKNNLVRLIEHFIHEEHVCLVFELLDTDLFSLIEMSIEPLSLSEIRVISQQVLVTLNALKSIQMTHADIKPDNIMLIDHEEQPFKVKLIDFGFAFSVSEMYQGIIIQAVSYRAPEVILGLPLNEAVDMWSLGCVLAFLYLGEDLYPHELEDKIMRDIVQMQGMPEHQLLKNGLYAEDFFEYESPNGPWRLRQCQTKARQSPFDQFNSLDDVARPEVKDGSEYEDTQAFLSLLKMMLQVDPKKRITPSEALEHTFITRKHLPGNTDDEIVKSASLTIKKCQLEEPTVEEIVETAANTSNGPSATAGLHDTTATGINETPAGTDEAASPASVNLNSNGINTGDEETTGFVEVKTRKKSLKRIRKFFSRIFKSAHSQQEQSSVESKCSVTSSEEICWNGAATTSLHDPLSADEKTATNTTNGPSATAGFIEVKTRKKWFKRISGFLSWMYESASCCTTDVIE